MTEIDRRALLGVTMTGAGLILAGCQDKNTAMLTNNSSGPPLGECENWGDLVDKDAPDGKTAAQFAPTTICCVYIVLENNRIRVRHAYWHKKTTMGLDEQAKLMMVATAKGVYPAEIGSPIRIEDNFERFGFNSKTKIYFFINNKPAEFGFIDRARQHIIRFTQYSSNDKVISSTIHKNFTFYHLWPVNFGGGTWPFSDNANGYSLDYWDLDDDGHDIDAQAIPYNQQGKYYLYAMNIHLQMMKLALAAPSPVTPPNDTPIGTPMQAYLPIILDPDTGNMGGTP